MSELANRVRKCGEFRWQLLASVSVLSLVIPLAEGAAASESGQPTVWVEAGVILDELENRQQNFLPPFVPDLLENSFTAPSYIERPPHYSLGEEARISFVPSQSNWKFSVALRYGRANSSGNRHEETSLPSPVGTVSNPVTGYHASSSLHLIARRFADTVSRTDESHAVLDFQAGRDVGLGLFAKSSSSTIQLGVRFAQFNSHSTTSISGDPNFTFSYKYFGTPSTQHQKIPKADDWDIYKATIERAHSFTGIGPSVDWNFNTTLAGQQNAASISFDGGINGAILFGRQKARIRHETSAHHGSKYFISYRLVPSYQTARDSVRSRAVIVPNIGGFAGFSLRFPNAKVSLGYRADFFLGAMDGGIDTRKTYDRNFYGPFATISIGLGG